jgi:hypothetical protein
VGIFFHFGWCDEKKMVTANIAISYKFQTRFNANRQSPANTPLATRPIDLTWTFAVKRIA